MEIKVHIQEFSQDYGVDVTNLLRLNSVSNVAVVFRVKKAPFLYISSAVLTALFWMYMKVSFPAAIFLSIVSSGFIAICTLHGMLYYLERNNGRLYPKKLLASDRGTFLIALDANKTPNQLVGTVGVQELSATRALIVLLCVHKKYRKTGISKRLLNLAIEHCKNHGFKIIQVDVWGTGIVFPVERMYEKNGFIETRREYAPFSFFPLVKVSIMEKQI